MKLRYKILNGILVLLLVSVTALAVTVGYTSGCGAVSDIADGGESMTAVRYTCYGPPDVLQLDEVVMPRPGDGEVLVKIQSAAVNPLDWHYMRGSPYLMRLMSGIGAPNVQSFGVDFAGTVERVGGDVSQFKPGDAVFGGASGAFGQFLVMGADKAVTGKPENMSFAEVAAIPIAAVSALQALRDAGHVAPGMKVLINGASGGVGTYAVQLAKHFGTEVTGVCSARNAELVRSLGADRVIDYKTDDYTEQDQQYDIIIDNVGNHSPFANSRALTPEGVLVMVGGPSGDWIAPLIRPLQAAVLSPFVDQRFVLFLAQLNQDDLATLAELGVSGVITPIIDRHYALEDIQEAIQYSESGRARGKIIIDIE